ncbi:MAG TPA: type IX secretion system membrane protein PorP/SprF [Bacteroidetes bacterium]|nr:type IX secretion system membrane protein PorP/SprF [Bacteroidota bacterium]
MIFPKPLRRICIVILIVSPLALHGQDPLLNTAGTWTYNPSWYNPAITGSKDFNSINFTYATGEDYYSMILNGDTRLVKKIKGYYNIPDHYSYRNIGIGYYLFNRSSEDISTTGFKASGSYHIKLDENSMSFLSIGLSLQATMNKFSYVPDMESPDSTILKTSYDPNVDFGLYYYSPSFYAGISATGILEGFLPDDSIYYGHEERHYHFLTGYKFVLFRPLNLLIEPSVIFSVSDTTFNNFLKRIHPMLKIYIDNFCLGTYYYDRDRISLFFRYNYPGFYIGGFLAVSRKSPYYKSVPSIELSAGINLSYNKSRQYKRFHW